MNHRCSVTVEPAKSINGTLRLPGDKSISHRYALLSALAEGTSRFTNFSSAADCASSLSCIEQLGAKVVHQGGEVEITGCGGALQQPLSALDCGNSGSTMRMLAGVLAAQNFRSELYGDASLSRRPMRRIMEPLNLMGGDVQALGERPPLVIEGRQLHGIHYKTVVPSAQVKSCVLLAGLHATGETIVEESVRTRDHTELALRAYGAEIESEGLVSRLRGGQRLHAIEACVPGDISTAAFFLCAAAILPGSHIVLENIVLNPTRATLLDTLDQLGLEVKILGVEEKNGELVGSIEATYDSCEGLVVEGETAAQLIDELPVLAAIGAYTNNGVEIRDARELRVKESDRIAAVADNLRRMGIDVEEREDGWRIEGSQRPHGAEIEAFGDHRIAMAFAVAALAAEGETVIQGSEAVAVSFPGFFSTLNSVLQR
jgi:3-phosphoshikimate 1-carboxyvinyltransferase